MRCPFCQSTHRDPKVDDGAMRCFFCKKAFAWMRDSTGKLMTFKSMNEDLRLGPGPKSKPTKKMRKLMVKVK